MQENKLIEILIWTIGVIISLTVGSNMINETLTIQFIPSNITIISGWIIIIGTIISMILSVFKK
jgi:hypothetical protein